MNEWNPLDLITSHPAPEELVALRLIPCSGRATFYKSPRYDIGVFKLDPNTGRKLWWHGTHGCEDPIRLKKHYDIRWCQVPDER